MILPVSNVAFKVTREGEKIMEKAYQIHIQLYTQTAIKMPTYILLVSSHNPPSPSKDASDEEIVSLAYQQSLCTKKEELKSSAVS